MSNNQTEQLKAQALQLRNIKSNLENQAAHSQIVLNGAKALESLANMGSMKGANAPQHESSVAEISKFIIIALSNMFVPPAPPQAPPAPLVVAEVDPAMDANGTDLAISIVDEGATS